VIADRLSIYVNATYNNADQHNGTTLLLATIFFAFQIYCDFSGYSDIAIGSAKVMGFKLMTNFNRPYFARNISEFWKRWHISLSTWFKDYLYISLGGNKVSVPRWYFNLFFVFLVSGLWHGANWTYIIWGALNGFYLVFAIMTQGVRNKINDITGIHHHPKFHHLLQILTTFALSCFAWVFFRANNVNDAFTIIGKIFTLPGPLFYESASELIYPFTSILLLLAVELKNEFYKGNFSFFNNEHWVIRLGSYTTLIIIILVIGVFDGGQFIYFQF
jgi:D-alanyl-lipoteichoic acid acyltransferase DltB (MBOAT superfamily)